MIEKFLIQEKVAKVAITIVNIGKLPLHEAIASEGHALGNASSITPHVTPSIDTSNDRCNSLDYPKEMTLTSSANVTNTSNCVTQQKETIVTKYLQLLVALFGANGGGFRQKSKKKKKITSISLVNPNTTTKSLIAKSDLVQ